MAAQKLLTFCLSSLFAGGLFLILPRSVYAAALQLSPPGGTVAVGSAIQVKINLSLTSGESVDGVDAVLNFDKDKLEITQIDTGSLFPSYPLNTFSNSAGTISVSGVVTPGSPVTSGGTLATITFKGKSAGTATVTFDFTSGDRNDSNVAQTSTSNDILESVVNGSYTVSGSSSGGDGGVGGGSDSGTDAGTGLPTTGNQETTLALFMGGLLVLGVGSAWRFLRA